jgi:hypothetical protein
MNPLSENHAPLNQYLERRHAHISLDADAKDHGGVLQDSSWKNYLSLVRSWV